jgi:hypothetical protein
VQVAVAGMGRIPVGVGLYQFFIHRKVARL